MICVRKTTSISSKTGVTCFQIVVLFLVFLIASFAQYLVLLLSVYNQFKSQWSDRPFLTAKEGAIEAFKGVLKVEMVAAAISAFTSLLIGYLFEMWMRKKVLALTFAVLAVGLLLPALRD